MIRSFLFLSILGFLFADLTVAVATEAESKEPTKLDGTYEGEMALYDEASPRTIPLSLVLILTDQVEKVEVTPGVFEVMKVIDGNFLVDKEGGPYAFSKVTYRLNTSEIDLSYKRTRGVTVGQPASFRLVGKVKKGGVMVGRVLSSFKGQIGTFLLRKTELHPLVSRPQYVGIWYGIVRLLPEGEYERFGISIAPTGFASINPDPFEFDYSMGRMGHLDFGIIQCGLPHVAIDYLHRRVSLSNDRSTTDLAVDASLDPKTHHLIGFFTSRYGGKRGEFDLERIE